MRRLLLLPAILLIIACAPPTASEIDRPGSPAVYDRIESLTNCSELQDEFDRAMDNYDRNSSDISLSYALIADARMREVGCYDY